MTLTHSRLTPRARRQGPTAKPSAAATATLNLTFNAHPDSGGGEEDRRVAAVIEACILATLVCATVAFGAVNPIGLAGVELALFLLGCAALLQRTHAPVRASPRTPLDLPVLLLVAVPLVQLVPLPATLVALLSPGTHTLREQLGLSLEGWTTLSVYPFATWLGLHRLAAAAVLFFLVTRIVTSPQRVRTFLLVLFVLGTLEAAYGLAAYLLGDPELLGTRRSAYANSVTGTLVNRNHFAGLMTLLLPLGLAYTLCFATLPTAAHKHRRERLVVGLIACTIMGVALVFTRSRAGILCSALTLAFGSLASGHLHGERRLALALVLASLLCGAWIGLDAVGDRLTGDLMAEVRRGRLALWGDGWAMAMRFPLIGSGIGTWASLFPAFKTMPQQITLSHAHNDYLEMLAEGGVVGLTLVLVILGRLFATLMHAATRATPRSRATLTWLGAGLGGLALHGFVDFNFQIPSNLFLFVAVAGVSLVIARDPQTMLGGARGAGSPQPPPAD